MKKFSTIILSIITATSLLTLPVSASCSEDQLKQGCVDTAILGSGGCSCDNGDGSSVINILNLVIDIMTVGIGILGVIGISVVGIQYLTAGGNEEKTRKAKRRMFEIVIGLVAYVVLYAFVKWIMSN